MQANWEGLYSISLVSHSCQSPTIMDWFSVAKSVLSCPSYALILLAVLVAAYLWYRWASSNLIDTNVWKGKQCAILQHLHDRIAYMPYTVFTKLGMPGPRPKAFFGNSSKKSSFLVVILQISIEWFMNLDRLIGQRKLKRFLSKSKGCRVVKSTTGQQCKLTRNKHGMVTRLTC